MPDPEKNQLPAQNQFNAVAWPTSLPLDDIWSLQLAVGFRLAAQKEEKLKGLEKDPRKLVEFILENPLLVVLGPHPDPAAGKPAPYAFDHNHFAKALIGAGHKPGPVKVHADFSDLRLEDFLQKMQDLRLLHPYDENGVLQPLGAFPLKIKDLKDDPYRSLAGFARHDGAFEKTTVPFAEFQWANYYRTRIPAEMLRDSFKKAVKEAVNISGHPDAATLPGYKKPGLLDRVVSFVKKL